MLSHRLDVRPNAQNDAPDRCRGRDFTLVFGSRVSVPGLENARRKTTSRDRASTCKQYEFGKRTTNNLLNFLLSPPTHPGSEKMKIPYSFLIANLLFASVAFSQETESIEGIGPTGPLKLVGKGFRFSEGPAADADGRLYFSDVRASNIHRLADDGSVELWLKDSGGANGLMFNAAGNLLACQAQHGRIVSFEMATKELTPIASEYGGKRFNGTNDLTVDRQGGVYFTDPKSGRAHQDSAAFYYAAADGTVKRLADDLKYPNGVLLSPDEKTLYVLQYLSPELMAYQIKSPGVLGRGTVLCDLACKADHPERGGDGMTVDLMGNLYVTVPSIKSIQVIDSRGKSLGIIPLPVGPTNCTFAGPDRKTLYVTTAKAVYSLPMQAQGHDPAKLAK